MESDRPDEQTISGDDAYEMAQEIINNGITGLLVEDGNIEQLAEKMQWMIEHGEERIKMGERAREAIKKYSLETIMLKWVHIFDELD